MNSADTVSGSVKGHDAPILERNWCFSSFFNVSVAFVCSSCKAWLMKLRYEVQCAPQHSLLGRMLLPCKDHFLPVSLKWWLGWLRKHDFMRGETPVWECSEAVELLVEKCIKPPNTRGKPNVMDQVWLSQVNPLPIEPQAPLSAIICFISGLLNFARRRSA